MNPPDHPDHLAAADEQAALWAGRLAGDELTASDRRELAAWLAQHPRHRTLLSDYVALSRDAERLMPQLAALGRVAVPAPAETAKTARPTVARGWLLGGALAVAAAVAVLFLIDRPTPAPLLETGIAAHAAHPLPDGSQVDLNARTQLAVEFARDERRVRLVHGEALFAVAKDATRLFIVDTTAGEVRVTGTKFNVRLESADVVEVTVLEGSVVVAVPGAKGDPLKLKPGDQLVVTGGAANIHQVTSDQLQDAIAWVKGFVVFDRMPLRDAAARFASYHDKRIEVDAALATKTYGGKHRIADLDGFLQAVPLQIPEAEITSTPEGVIRIGLRK
ncbi:MAG: hypothetical protein C0518_03050 [Opitutus sp.]|nr:hypothetical protein [Opitutus sp.]